MSPRPDGTGSFARGWLALWAGFALHVLDEAANDFLALYNPAVRAIRDALPWLPLPTFSFAGWLAMLVAALLVLLALTPAARRGAGWLRPVGFAFCVVMIGNGLLHVAASAYLGRPVAGVYSAPLLLLAGAFLWRDLLRSRVAVEHAD